jgi:hypothetical protein
LFRLPMEIDGAAAGLELDVAGADVAELELELELLLELQAAMSSAALTPAATTPAFLMEDTNIPRLLAVACPGAPRVPRERIRIPRERHPTAWWTARCCARRPPGSRRPCSDYLAIIWRLARGG